MVTRKPPYRAVLAILTKDTGRSVASLMTVTLLFAAGIGYSQSSTPLTLTSGNAPSATFFQDSRLPNLLSQQDSALYEEIFDAQRKGDWAVADRSIRQLRDKLLLGHVLAERYLDRRHNTSTTQLSSWMSQYGDHPQAANIYALAIAKSPTLKDKFPSVRRPMLSGYGDDANPIFKQEDPRFYTWRAGIDAWRNGRKVEAAMKFASLAEKPETLSPWTAAAVHYWAYRAYNDIGNATEANRQLKLAAEQPRSFYGILARRQMNQRLNLDKQPVTLTDSDILEIIGEPPVRRTLALVQTGHNDLADKEMRALFPQAEKEEKSRLLALAHELKLAAVQISMARSLSKDGRAFDFARYPVPRWQPEGGFKVDPALVFALMRQESGFRISAVSSNGALGLMQLMPQTASMMHKQLNNDEPLHAASVSEPVTNVTLGQTYVQHLLKNNLVEGNLFYMLAAYNAGPGRLQTWKKELNYNDDPLLFVESIPYGQTRSYVMQVMANYWIYSEITGRPSMTIHAVAKGKWPRYDESTVAAAQKSDKPS